jgi:aspartyl-tRNA(Asn)/glutamyl-tRNA(Gln) amidotransferase subunit C
MISKEEIEHLKHLARVGFDEKATDSLAKDLSSILVHIEKLKEANVDDAKAMTHSLDSENVVRADKQEGEDVKLMNSGLINQFPEKKDEYLVIKSPLQK